MACNPWQEQCLATTSSSPTRHPLRAEALKSPAPELGFGQVQTAIAAGVGTARRGPRSRSAWRGVDFFARYKLVLILVGAQISLVNVLYLWRGEAPHIRPITRYVCCGFSLRGGKVPLSWKRPPAQARAEYSVHATEEPGKGPHWRRVQVPCNNARQIRQERSMGHEQVHQHQLYMCGESCRDPESEDAVVASCICGQNHLEAKKKARNTDGTAVEARRMKPGNRQKPC
mmetsp:Transcript_12682/g.46336  ORF Transcript_12682/g.46336 Transcript_12682/m.46336 type:complete len:229 (+) Transcript_12682:940-1626(+)